MCCKVTARALLACHSKNFFLNRQKKRLNFRLYIFKEVNENVNGCENFASGRENFVNGREN